MAAVAPVAMIPLEIDLFGIYVPLWLIVPAVGFVVALGIVRLLEIRDLTRFIWHLPLFFLALATLLSLVFAFLVFP